MSPNDICDNFRNLYRESVTHFGKMPVGPKASSSHVTGFMRIRLFYEDRW